MPTTTGRSSPSPGRPRTDAEAAARALARAAAERLDLAGHTGVHPRIGAVDVVPFVALAGLGTCRRGARRP